MAGFIYYVPSQQSQPPDELRYAFDGEVSARSVLRNGPDGNSGTLFAQGRNNLGYYPEKQTWVKIPRTDDWLGWDTSDKPGPTDLARRRQVPGQQLVLEDGNFWLLPIAVSYVDQGATIGYAPALPQVLVGNDNGDWVLGPVVESCRQLWDVAERYWQHRISAANGENDGTVDVEDLINWCVVALAANYRLAKHEVMAMQLLSTANFNSVLLTVVDEAARLQMQESLEKKSPKREVYEVGRVAAGSKSDLQADNRRSVPFDASVTV